MSNGSDVIDFKIRRSISKHNFCSHAHVIIDDLKKTIECEDCGAFLDPWNVLLMYAKWAEQRNKGKP